MSNRIAIPWAAFLLIFAAGAVAWIGVSSPASASSGARLDSPGIARLAGSTRTWYLTNTTNGTGVTDQFVTWAGQAAGDVPLVGDWNGDGTDTPGIARYAGGTWTFYLTNVANGTGVTDQIVSWAGTLATDVPLVGDWTGDGKDSPGLARFSGSTWTFYTTNIINGTGVTDQIVTWAGQTTSDNPLVGDWTGSSDTLGAAIVAAAQAETSIPYCSDAGNITGPTACTDNEGRHWNAAFDCSGLTMYAVYHATGITLPHSAADQYNDYANWGGARIAKTSLQPGDLVFFIGSDGTFANPGHVGVYIGNGNMIDAQQDGVPVQIHPLQNDYVGAVRYW